MILPLECKGRGPHLADMWQLGPWCNGNTTGFGSVIRGSNPRGPTLRRETEIDFVNHTFSPNSKI